MKFTTLALSLLALAPISFPRAVMGTERPASPLVKIAELRIEPTMLEPYKAALHEEIRTSLRLEAGVLAIYAVTEKDDPSRFRFFEIYANHAAYERHIASAHFQRYLKATNAMVLEKILIDTTPIEVEAKPH